MPARALRVADAAILVVDAVSGVQVQTEKTWQAAEETGLPRLVVVNRLDRERGEPRAHASPSRFTPRSSRYRPFPSSCRSAEEKSFRGVINLRRAEGLRIFCLMASGKFSEG